MELPASRVLSEARKKIVAARQHWKCFKCTNQLASTYQVDHIVGLYAGGTNDEKNLQALCPNCHAQKTQLEAIERADKLWKDTENKRRQHLIDTREDRVITKDGVQMYRCETCFQTRPLTEGWESHTCSKLKLPTQTLSVYAYSSPRDFLSDNPVTHNIEIGD